jgi:hypothetical protein
MVTVLEKVRFMRVLFRVSKGKAFIQFKDIEDGKAVFLVAYTSIKSSRGDKSPNEEMFTKI